MLALQPRLLFLPAVLGLLAPAAPSWAQAAAGAAPAASARLVVATPESRAGQQYAAEDQRVRQGIVRRAPGEADTTFLKRLFPVSFAPEQLVAYAWRPGAFGKQQLFFPRREVNEYRREGEDAALFVLDPFRPNTYAVQKLRLESIGDITNLSAFFFADVDRDGQKELLALVYAEVQEVGTLEHGNGTTERAYARMSHQHTYVFRYAGPTPAGHPRYRADTTPRPYLNGLRTAAAVRWALARR